MARAIRRTIHSESAGQPGLFARLRQAVADYREYRAIYDDLATFNDSELADLGLSRLNIRDIARDAVYGH